MSIKSNVVIKSNIYVNKTKSKFDKDFISNVRGYEALKQVSNNRGPMASWQFTAAQRAELEYGPPNCSLDKSGTKSWGIIIENGIPVFVCKCEKVDCPGLGRHKGYSECSNYSEFRNIEREQGDELLEENRYITPDFGLLRYLDTDDRVIYLKTIKPSTECCASPEIIVKPNVIDFTESKTGVVDNSQRDTVNIVTLTPENTSSQPRTSIPISVEYERIDKPNKIIEANIEDKIIVNAGPGTGKTYSVIKRLGYIIENELAAPTNVLVLCYSRSAVGVIKNRIRTEIQNRSMPAEAMLLFNSIRTFDSFVTYMLSEGELEATINSLNYDERIERFIAELTNDKTALDGLEYLIVDEMQDLVGVRARMVKAILEQVECGFLLLGDMCQSIYDYNIQDETELNSVRYYEWLNSRYKTEVKRFELTRNVRQKEEIAMFTEYMRDAILSQNIEKQVESLALCVGTLQDENNIGNIRNLITIKSLKSEAYLCRNNAEVSIISAELFARDIKHRISKRAQHIDLVPWIAEILATYTEKRIGITAFKERALAAGYNDAKAKWALLKSVAADENENVLDVKLLVKMLVGGKELPAELDLANNDIATISTIHRAKGREYEEVVLISDDYKRTNNTFDEIKVAYVAFTRGKQKISFCDIPKKYIRQLDSKRWIATGLSRKNNKIYCSNFDIGFDDDVNPFSVVNKNIEDVHTRQMFIAKLKPGDLLDAWFIEGEYRLFYQGIFVGMLSNKVKYDLRDAMNKTNHSPRLPNHISNIYVNNVVTIANTRFNDVIAEPYSKSGLWLGIEISGFTKTDWS